MIARCEYPHVYLFYRVLVNWLSGSLVFWSGRSMASQGIWYGLLAGLSASAVLLYIRFIYLSRKLINQVSEGKTTAG